MPSTLTLTASRANLQRVALIRLIVIAGQLGGLVFARWWLQAEMDYAAPLVGVGALAAITAITFWRLRWQLDVSDGEFFGHLLCDISLLTVMLYFSGGVTNPFVSYYLVPISIAAAVLPTRFTVTLTTLSLAAHSLLLFHYHPLSFLLPHSHDGTPNLHLVGMWCDFAISAILITFFVSRMANALRQQQQELNRNRENALHHQQLVSVATLAAGTAHELGTPLSTMTVLLDEMIEDNANQPALRDDLQLLQRQVEGCRTTLQKLVATAETHHRGNPQQADARQFLHEALDRWQVMRPRAQYRWRDNGDDARIPADPVLEQALLNLLNNAADASPEAVEVRVESVDNYIQLQILDRGNHAELPDRPFVSRKHQGLGLGLFLSRAAAERYGGQLRLESRSGGGTIAILQLPSLNPQPSPGEERADA